MKKTFIAGAAAALVLLMGTCMPFEEPGPVSEFDEFGRQVVTLTILTGDEGRRSRNMTLDTGIVGINYYEVVFYGNSTATPTTYNYYRAAGPRGKTLTVRLPVGFPLNSVENAIVFGGAWAKQTDEKVLLATGNITHQNWGGTPATSTPIGTAPTVTTATESIRFELSPLNTRFDTSTTSSFQITGTANHPYTEDLVTTPITDVNYMTTTAEAATFQYANRIGSVEARRQLWHKRDLATMDLYPYFKLPKAIAKAPAATAATATATFSYGLNTAHLPGIRTNISSDFVFDSYAIFTGYKEDGLTAVTAVPGGGLSPTPAKTNVAIPASFPIDIAMRSEPLNEGFCMLVISLQVKAISTANGDGDWWTLSNGMFDYEVHDNNKVTGAPEYPIEETDFDPTVTDYSYGASLGGAIMLCIGEPKSSTTSRPIRIIISPLTE
ncbi:MAG: hypothetical protein LBH97_01780 [Treponema sp.]|jgi:hypothetical protein|nr:hypothetical protein [Treponema sp.]